MKKYIPRLIPFLIIALLIPANKLTASDISVAQALSNAFADISESVSPSVVTITSEQVFKHPAFDQFKGYQDMLPKQLWPFLPDGDQEMRSTSLGSGIVISKDGYILTNNHVIEKGENIKVQLSDNTELDAKIIGADHKTDVALIKVDAKKLTPLKMGDSDDIRVGEWVLAIGSPFSGSLSQSVTQGIISAVGRSEVGLNDYENFIQTDAAINPGNSGGALVNLDGELIGMNSAIASRSGGYQGIGFAIPINLVNRIVEDLRSSGRVTRAWLGVYIQEVDATMAKTLGLDKAMGALVGQVLDGSPAEDAKLKQGDVIIEFDGQEVANSRQLPMLVSTQRPDEKKKLKVMREGKIKTLSVVLGELPEEGVAVGPPQTEETDIGFTVETPNRDRLRFYNFSQSQDGVLVSAVDRDSEAFKKNIRKGFLIQKMGPNVRNLETVKTKAAFEKGLEVLNAGDTILLLVRRDNDNTFFVALTLGD